ncbi:MAG: extracellular solute-binding protein [Bacilli bacterium]|nr:extracellular solute-binding protein [Bacilli bacterium]
MKSFKHLIFAVPMLIGLVACGGGGSTPAASSSSSEASSSAAPSSDVSFSFWHTFGQGNTEALQNNALEFSRIIKERDGVNLTINIEYQGGYSDILDKVNKSFNTGLTPTMAVAYPDHVADYLRVADGKYVYNLEDYFKDAEIGFGKQEELGDKSGTATYGYDDFYEAFIEEGTQYVKAGTYSMPFMKSSEVLFYNVEAVKNAMKIYKPEIESDDAIEEFIANMTWDELFEICDVARENKDKVLNTIERPFFYDSDSNLFISKMFQNEIPYSSIGNDGKGKIDFETGEARAEAEEMVSEIKAQYDRGNLNTKGVDGGYGSTAFTDGKCIFTVGSSGGAGYNNVTGGSFHVGVCKVPASNDNPLYVTQGPTLTFLRNPGKSDAENDLRMKYAWQFAKFITNPAINVMQCVYGSEGYFPVRYSAVTSSAYQEFLKEKTIYSDAAKVLIDDIDGNYLNTAIFPGSAELRDQCEGIIKLVLTDKKDVTTAFTDAIAQTKLVLN